MQPNTLAGLEDAATRAIEAARDNPAAEAERDRAVEAYRQAYAAQAPEMEERRTSDPVFVVKGEKR